MKGRNIVTSKIQAEFCITSNQVTPMEITNAIEIAPSRTWLAGDFIQNTKLRRKHNGWCLSSNEDNIFESIRTVLGILLPKSELIRKLCDSYDISPELSCVIYIVKNKEIPAFNFDQNIISGLARLNASVDIDIIRTL
jgi:hypothetical protein